MALSNKYFQVDFGGGYAALGTVGYTLSQTDGTVSVARTTTGIVDLGNGQYGVVVPTIPDNAASVKWDTGGGSPVHAISGIDDYRQNFDTQDDIAARPSAVDIANATLDEIA